VSELEQQLLDRLMESCTGCPHAKPEVLIPLVKRLVPILIETGIVIKVDRTSGYPILTYYKPNSK
jgi:hypothetical protein